jgi:hypothetical protein
MEKVESDMNDFLEYAGESKKCLIKYGDIEINIGYTLMHNLIINIENKMTYGKDLGTLQKRLRIICNKMAEDAERELILKEKLNQI